MFLHQPFTYLFNVKVTTDQIDVFDIGVYYGINCFQTMVIIREFLQRDMDFIDFLVIPLIVGHILKLGRYTFCKIANRSTLVKKAEFEQSQTGSSIISTSTLTAILTFALLVVSNNFWLLHLEPLMIKKKIIS